MLLKFGVVFVNRDAYAGAGDIRGKRVERMRIIRIFTNGYEFAGRHNVRSLNTQDQMKQAVMEFTGKRLIYNRLTEGAE